LAQQSLKERIFQRPSEPFFCRHIKAALPELTAKVEKQQLSHLGFANV
jgi:hypothetical protein